MRTYTDLFAAREFRNLFLANCAGIAAHTTSALALGALTYASTGSALITALSMFGAPLAGVLGSLTLLSAADSLPPRRALTLAAVLVAAGAAVQAVPGVPLWTRFAIIFVSGYVGSITGGARWALLTDILPANTYVLARATMNTSVGVMQIAGFGLAGALLVWLSPEQVFLLAAVLRAVAAAVGWFGLAERPVRATERTTIARTLRVNRELWADRGRRSLFLNLWVPGGLIVGCEALFIPYAGDRAGFLFAAAALGMLIGDVVVGRFLSAARRERWVPALRLLLAVPYLVFLLSPPLPLAIVVALVASIGFAGGLPLQERLIARSPSEARGQVLGLHQNGMLAGQALCAVLAGAIADLVPTYQAVALLAGASLAATVALTSGLRRTAPAPVAATKRDG
ncbi:MFS transporter [Micromonospora zamorensis]|uniref:MFS transporter n=1 Tax=Micromonospora zamorensis TaxID=709883 RepID=UPI00081FCB05|nr:MFS transporter [Micromonospora zamorensis]WSK50833.1 MFS transporter [Micromonospora zamorensis]WTE86612.1 MFS transporter [Micromonospora zamorensis]SCG62555.1 Predicted arabinose efflux permease, MFS family [Micromonospora zamorensis]